MPQFISALMYSILYSVQFHSDSGGMSLHHLSWNFPNQHCFFAHHFYWVSVEMLPNNPIIIYLTGPDEQRHVSTLQEKEVHTVVMTQEWLESSHTIWECIACSTFTKPFQVRFWLWYCCSSCCVKPIGGLLHCELCSDWSRSLQQNSN